MSIIGWIVFGLIAGFIASKIVNKTGEGIILDIILEPRQRRREDGFLHLVLAGQVGVPVGEELARQGQELFAGEHETRPDIDVAGGRLHPGRGAGLGDLPSGERPPRRLTATKSQERKPPPKRD